MEGEVVIKQPKWRDVINERPLPDDLAEGEEQSADCLGHGVHED